MKTLAFSLIELLVVITIIGVLAAIAVPAYSSYIVRSRFGTIMQAMGGLMENSITYAAIHGHFGNSCEIGVCTTGCWPFAWVANANIQVAISPYLGGSALDYGHSLVVGDLGNGDFGGTPCGAIGAVYVDVDLQLVGIPNATDPLLLRCDYWHYQGIINKVCSYSYNGSNIVPGALNLDDPVQRAQYQSLTSTLNNATCQ